MNSRAFAPFPIPVVASIGPGSQPDDEGPAVLPLPQGMSTYQAPALPDPEALREHGACLDVLRQALAALSAPDAAAGSQVLDLAGLPAGELALLNQVLGEGEVAAQRQGDPVVCVQESVFAGLWRVVSVAGGVTLSDTLEIGAVPRVLVGDARGDGALPAEAPDGVMNAPALLAEIDEQRRSWRAGDPPHVMNLSLLPLSPADSAHLDACLGTGRVQILSRGYGNCRIVDTRVPRTWRVTHFNSSDVIILDTLEICPVPVVACAAAEDLADSAERLAEVLQWIESA